MVASLDGLDVLVFLRSKEYGVADLKYEVEK